MKRVGMKFGGVACAAVMLLLGAPVQAADQSGATTAATELGKRAKQPQTGERGGLSERDVRNMMYYAFSLVKGPDGKPIDIDKGDQATIEKYSIPYDSAQRVIRAATRSAYADVCGLPELGEANYRAMVVQEKTGKHQWTAEQLQMVDALYLFSVSFFTGNAKITVEPTEDEAGEVKELAPPKCPPEQKQKVESAIKAYVASVEAN